MADLIVDRLAEHTGHLFGVGGANIEDIYDAVHRTHTPLTGIVAKHEFGAATMADGYARSTGRLGVVAATSGGGAMNLLAALAESFDSRTPVLALVGQPPLPLEGRGAFQDTSGGPGRLDAHRIFAAVSRYCAKLTRAEDIHVELDRAIAAAQSGGPAVLLLPKDIQAAPLPPHEYAPPPIVAALGHARPMPSGPTPGSKASETGVAPSVSMPLSAVRVVPPTGQAPSGEAPVAAGSSGAGESVDRAVTLLAGDHGGPVVVIAGPEVARADARAALAALVAALDASVLVTPDAKDAFPNDDPHFAGVVGIMGHPHAPKLVSEAAVCVLAGATLSMTARAGLDDPLAACPVVVHLGDDDPFVPVHGRVRGELGAALQVLADAVELSGSAVPQELRNGIPELSVPVSAGPGVRYREAVAAIAARLEPGTDVVADAGNTGAAVVHYLPVPADGRFLIALGMGGMGYAFGAGVGSALGRGRRTCVIAGDGAYFMHGHEVHTAVEHSVPVTFIVFNNNAHAMCVTREQLYYSGDYTYNRFGAAEIGAGVAAMFPHLPAWSATTLTEFEDALDRARGVAGPSFIELRCDPDEIPPFAPFLKEFA
ncbi:thiamine pyrophosphate-binding protein [Nocardia sp. NPDC020380]|uniref:thiamine pyrophosphate-binding protein n=1 Tax=Nocardia sp. NPDC020380 TaxID=3364309 RepID=UPI00379A4000